MNPTRASVTAYRPGSARAGGQRGVSLVELMISLVIGLLILAALVALFVNTSAGNRQMAQANNVIENGRLAIELLEADVVHAGYWGGHMPAFDDQTASGVPADAPTVVPQPCKAYLDWTAADRNNLINVPLNVYDSDAFCNTVVTDKLAGTDVLVVRHAELCTAGPDADDCEADVAGKLYFQVTRCVTDVTKYLLETSATSAFPLLTRDCADIADKRRFVSSIYYIRDYAVTNGDGIPTLMRSQFDLTGAGGLLAHQAPVALVEGIQAFRIELGIDNFSKVYDVAGVPTSTAVNYGAAVDWLDPLTRTIPKNRGDGTPDNAFVRCTTLVPCTLDQLTNVTAVKIYVLVRSREPTRGYTDTKTYTLGSTVLGPFNDEFRRHVYVSTVRLPNISGRRQTP